MIAKYCLYKLPVARIAIGCILLIFVVYSGCISADKKRGDGAPRASDTSNSAANNRRVIADDNSEVDLIENASAPPGAAQEFPKTDFSISRVDYADIISGGPPRDGIPAIRNPHFQSVAEADMWLEEGEMVFVIDGQRYDTDSIHIYPVSILIYHEIINDRFGDTPIAVTYCPLCNSALAFLAQTDNNDLLTFGVSGRLRYSNMIMFDDQHESWWQQATGQAIVGVDVGTSLQIEPLITLSWGEAKSAFPSAQVVSRNTGFTRPYGRNPYVGYDTQSHPFLYRGPQLDATQNPFERVLIVRHNGNERPYLYSQLREQIVTADTVDDTDIVILWDDKTASPLDEGSAHSGRTVGSATPYLPIVDGNVLTFTHRNGVIVDTETRSVWSPAGIAVSGSLRGSKLAPLANIQHFWFSHTIFNVEQR